MAEQTVGQRISQLISHLGISKNAFASSLDKTATVIQHLVDERNKPGFDLMNKIFEVYPNVSTDWLMKGTGPMLTDATASEPRSAPATTSAMNSAGAPTTAAPVAEPAPTSAPEPIEPAAASVAPAPVAAPIVEPPVAPVLPFATTLNQAPAIPAMPAPTVDPTASLQAALYAQQLTHQLALAEMRNQHLQEQQRMMQQMMDMMQRQLSR
ncbi:helix-turn-helix domain-containing protein [Hymenobacter cavernae]|uniref:helix-turn-helix domain-containing protein n=1 Tax=Hymenobacter cavernae TaxID=2044852 RepID=UPI0016662EEE|nr:helix-turn-helix transcriptional regulator [Hymenobacter cavernae]